MANRSISLRIIMFLVWVVVPGIGLSTVGWAAGVAGDQAVTVNVLEDSPERILIYCEFGGFTRRPIRINGQSFTEIHLGGESLKKEKGAPALPDVSRSIIIPDDARMEVRVLDSIYYEISNIDIVPSKGYILRTVNPADVPYTFGKAYETDAFYPGPLATLREPYIMRDHRGIVVTANPFQYNPVKRVLRVYNYMTVEVAVVGTGEANVLKRDGRKRSLSRSFHDIYSSHFLNYGVGGGYAPLGEPPDEEGEMLIIVHDDWYNNVLPLKNHKDEIGIDTTVVRVSADIGDNNWVDIKAYIQNVYDTSDLAFVLLVGDLDEVDSPRVSTPIYPQGDALSDPTYSKLAGDDDYPDIIVGRFSAETAAHVNTQVERTIDYETTPATEQNWFWKGTGLGSHDEGRLGDDDEINWEHIRNIRYDLESYGYTDVDELYEGSQGEKDADGNPTPQMLAYCLNEGRGIINYCGHGDAWGWCFNSYPGQIFENSDVDDLTNDNMLPFIFSVACEIGKFDYSDYLRSECFAEAWMRATNGEPPQPTGAIGIYAASTEQSWVPPMEAQDEFNLLYVAELYGAFGAYCFAGSCSMMDEYAGCNDPYNCNAGDGVDMFNTWHIFGDPSLRIGGAGLISRFYIKNSSNEPVAWFDRWGNLFLLEGELHTNPNKPATGHDEFVVKDSSNVIVAIIDADTGEMYIDGEHLEWQAPSGENDFIFENSSGAVAYIDESGNLYLKGKLYENPD